MPVPSFPAKRVFVAESHGTVQLEIVYEVVYHWRYPTAGTKSS